MGRGFSLPRDSEPIFFDEKVKGYWLLGEARKLDTRFYPIGSQHLIFDEDKDDWIFHPTVILEYHILEAYSERYAKKLGMPWLTSKQYLESEERDKKLFWQELSKRMEQPPTFEEFMAIQDFSYRKMNLDEMPNKETILEYIEESIGDEKEYFFFHVDAQMYFDCDFSQKPVDEFDLKEWNIYKELADIYGYSSENSNRIFIRKHNAAKQLYISEMYEALNMSISVHEDGRLQIEDEVDTEESPDGYFWHSLHELFNYIMTQNRDFYPSKETFFGGLVALGKMSFEWDYGRNSHPDLIKEISERCNRSCNPELDPYTPLQLFHLSLVKDLQEDMLEKGAVKECGYCGRVFPFRSNKLYCSLVSEDRDCGKKARNQRYYIKKSLEKPTEN